MTITINGTTGITNDGGYTGDGVVFADATPANTLVTNTSGNVGIGAAPSAWSSAFGPVIQTKTGTGAGALTGSSVDNYRMFANTYYDGAYKRIGAGYATQYEQAAGTHVWSTAGTSTANSTITFAESMRIDTSGNLLVGTPSAGSWAGTAGIGGKGFLSKNGSAGSFGNNVFNIYWTGSVSQLWIDSTNFGTISVSSDYRIKRNIKTQTSIAIDRILQLRPVTYQMAEYSDLFKATDEIKEGFIAHEVQAVIPSGVDGQKDDESQIQSLRLDAILSVAVKAIQEQQALITQLQADVAALKAAA